MTLKMPYIPSANKIKDPEAKRWAEGIAKSFDKHFSDINNILRFRTLKVGNPDPGTANSLNIDETGNLTFLGDAGFYPRVVRQDAEPANGTGSTAIDDEEVLIWIDTNDSDKVYLMFNDNTNTNIVKVELT